MQAAEQATQVTWLLDAVYSRIWSTLVVADFLNEKKFVHSSNLHLWEDDGKEKYDSDWVTDTIQLWVMTASLMNNKL